MQQHGLQANGRFALLAAEQVRTGFNDGRGLPRSPTKKIDGSH